jgi:multidrug efflux system membrane fusion protein
VSPSADQKSRVFDVEVTIPNADGALKAGMIATVHMEDGPAATASPASVVPLSAIVRPPGSTQGYAVFAVEPDGEVLTARARKVTLGEVYGNMIEVGSGVKPGDRVIVAGATLVTDGERVRIVP